MIVKDIVKVIHPDYWVIILKDGVIESLYYGDITEIPSGILELNVSTIHPYTDSEITINVY